MKYAAVTADVKPTRATRHWVGGRAFGPASALAIASLPKEEVGIYLLCLDQDGNVVTDTWHASLEAALHQAAFEYEGIGWTDVADS